LSEVKYFNYLSQNEKITTESVFDIDNITIVHDLAFQCPTEGKIVQALRQNQHLTLSLVYWLNNHIVGHSAYSPIFVENQIIGLGLGPIAILPDFQRRGFGSQLIENGNRLALCQYGKIFVLGEPKFYRKFGFKLAKEWQYFSKYDPDGQHFMILSGDFAPNAQAVFVDYCDEFEQ